MSAFEFQETKWFRSHGQSIRQGRNWKLRIFLFLVLALVCVYVYQSVPYIPDLTLYFYQPSSSLSSTSMLEDWAAFAGDSQNSRFKSQDVDIKGYIKWQMTFTEATLSSPAVVDGMLYVGGYMTVYAMEARTGKIRWQYPTTGPVDSSPAAAGDYIYFGLLDGRLIALNRHNGALEWEYQTGNFITGSPVIENGVLFIGSGDGVLYAIDARSGHVIWQRVTKGTIFLSPVLKEGIIHVVTFDGTNLVVFVESYNARTGALRQRYLVYYDIEGAPVVAGEQLYFTTSYGNLYAIDRTEFDIPGLFKLKKLWRQLWIMGVPIGKPVPQRGTIWKVNPRFPRRGFTSSPAVSAERIFIGDRIGLFWAKRHSNGDTLWVFNAKSPILTAPLVLGEAAYIGTKSGDLFSINSNNGKQLWKLSLDAAINVSPVYGKGLIFVRTNNSKLHAIE